MATRRDLYGECNLEGAPEPDFKEQCCDKCLNPDCARSTWGTTRFENRVAAWEDKLFLNVARMPREDPRYPLLTAQGFVTIDVGPAPSVRGWDDPRDIQGGASVSHVRMPQEEEPAKQAPALAPPAPVLLLPPGFPTLREQPLVSPPPPVVEAAPAPPPEPPKAAPAPQAQPRTPDWSSAAAASTMNTPFQTGRMLQGAPSGASAQQGVDKWGAPVPPPANEAAPAIKVVPRGAKIRLGGG